MKKPDLDDWHVEVHYSRWTRFKRWVHANRKDIIITVCGIIAVAALLIVGPPICGGQDTMTWYYVDGLNGNDSNAGTYLAPWRTIATAVALSATFKPGDQVRIRPNAIYTDRLLVSGISGTAANPIVFQGDPDYGALRPIIASNNTNDVLVTSSNYITIARLDCRLPTSTPGSHIAVTGACETVLIDNCVISDTAAGVQANGIILGGTIGVICNNVTVKNCTLTNIAEDGIEGQGSVHNFIVENCLIDKCGDNTYAGSAGDGISFHEECNGIIRYNTIRRCSKGGIVNVQKLGHTITCHGNFISDCVRYGMCGHQNGTDTIGNHVWFANIILMADTTAILSGVDGAKPSGMLFRGRTDVVNEFFVYNNVIVHNVADALSVALGLDINVAHQIKITARNNVVLNGGGGFNVYLAHTSWGVAGTTFNYDAYSVDSSRFAQLFTAYTFANWQALAGMTPDVNGGIVSPGFVNQSLYTASPGAYNWATDANRWPVGRVASDFKLTNGSLLRRNGTPLSPASAYPDQNGLYRQGSTMDIGAFFGTNVSAPATADAGVLNSEQSASPPKIAGTDGKPSRAPKDIRFPQGPRRIDRTKVKHPIAVRPPKGLV